MLSRRSLSTLEKQSVDSAYVKNREENEEMAAGSGAMSSSASESP
jgi:hypothetical protein